MIRPLTPLTGIIPLAGGSLFSIAHIFFFYKFDSSTTMSLYSFIVWFFFDRWSFTFMVSCRQILGVRVS